MSNTYDRRRLMGLCLYCEDPPVFGMRVCEDCRQKSNDRAKVYRSTAVVVYKHSANLELLVEQTFKVGRLRRQLAVMKRGAA